MTVRFENISSSILREIGFFYPTSEARFVQRKTLLVNDSAMRRMHWRGSTLSDIPVLPPRRLLRLWLTTWKTERLELPTTADAVQISPDGKRLRGFDLRRDLSYKIVAVDSRYGTCTANEARVRKDVLPSSGLLFPRVHSLTRRGSYLMMEEELVHGRQWRLCLDGHRVCQDIAEPLDQLAWHFGHSKKPLSSVLPEGISAALNEANRQLPLVAHLQALIERNPQVVVSLCHGDVWASNLAVGNVGTVFLDWEMARENFVGYDLLNMARRYPYHKLIQLCARQPFAFFQGGALDFTDGMALRMLDERPSEVTKWKLLSAEWRKLTSKL